MDKPKITLPTIHMNGTSAETLVVDNLTIAHALSDVQEAIRKAEFNARDYYPVPGSWEKACAELETHAINIEVAKQYFMAIAEHAQQAVDERNERMNSRRAQ